MPCLLFLATLAMPRVVIVLLYLFSSFFAKAYESILFLALGFIFLPLTTIAYAWAINVHNAVDGVYLVVVIVAVLADLGLIGSHEAARRRRS
ncbi:MAG: hypothetical protein ABI165_03850 [Bryobacteraceae bacterium]